MKFNKINILSAVTVLFLLTFVRLAISGEKAPDEKDLGIPLYTEMQFSGYKTIKGGITTAQYCSSSPPALILKFYKKALKNAVEIKEGASEGMRYKLLLDVSSPATWMNSRKFIEIYKDTQKKGCSTIVQITVQPEILKGDSKILREAEHTAPVRSKRKYIGAGGYVNTINLSAGPTLILWPFKNIALQASYGVGTFTSFEARGFYSFDLSESLNPYLGAGYLHVEKDVTAIGLNTTVKEDSFTIFGGIELPIYKRLFAYVDVAGTPMKLEKDVTDGSRRAKVTVSYSSVTIGMGLVFYIF